ncbi:ligand-binding receptor [Motiliproteus sp. MSK22-1]|nr:ligand-binding receptor [Motiliproteus sp. MSK22-1]
MLILICGTAAAQTELRPLQFGMSTALSGPAAELGVNMRDGLLIAFDRSNRTGGIRGRELRLRVLDDAYEPKQTVQNLKQLVVDPRILAIVGNVGTPTAIAALPIIRQHQILFFAPFTGAGALRRSPPERYVINFRASYAEETAAMVDALIEVGGLEPQQIAFFTQRDGYGDAGFYGGIEALRRHGLENELEVQHVRYERNTLAVENALADLLYSESLPKAIIIVGAYTPVAKFIRLARDSDVDALMLNVSFVGSQPLFDALKEPAGNILVTQVVPHHNNKGLPVVAEYLEDVVQYDRSLKPSFGSLEGYLAGRVLIRALSSLQEDPDRINLIDALESLGRFDVGLNYQLELSPEEHQASHRVWPTVLTEQGVSHFEWTDIGRLLGGNSSDNSNNSGSRE